MKTGTKIFGALIVACVVALIALVQFSGADNMNSRFNDGALTQTSITATTGTITTLSATTLTATTANGTTSTFTSGYLTNLFLGSKQVVYAKYRAKPAGGAGDSVTVAGVDSDDIVIASMSEVQAAADSNLVLWNAIPANPTVGKVYLKFSKVPGDTVSVGIITIQD